MGDLQDQPEAETGSPEEPELPGRRHPARWFFLCIAASALLVTGIFLVQDQRGLPFGFGNTVLLGGLIGVLVPLIVAVLGTRFLRHSGPRFGFYYLGAAIFLLAAFWALFFINK